MTMENCKVCRKPSTSSCAACHAVFYCSTEHQKIHWKQHKSKCSAFVIKSNEVLGRHAVAARTLKAGSLIVDEIPVLYAPLDGEEDQVIPICLSCCKIMKEEVRECSNCKWPICSENCEKVEHADFECKIFAGKNVKFPPNIKNYYSGIMALRACLLPAKEPVLNLPQNLCISEEGDLCGDRKVYQDQINEFKVNDLCSIDDWSRMMDIIAVNAKDLDTEITLESKEQTLRGKYLFVQGSYFKHSCSSNCSWGISPGVNADLKIRTTVDVKKGDPLTLTYGCSYLQGTMERQREMRKHKLVCKCERCLDSTELGSNVSTLVCTSCNNPTVVSTNPFDEAASWKCSSCVCTRDAVDVINLINSKNKIVQEFPLNSSNIRDMINLLEELSGNVLHPHHWIINGICEKIFNVLVNAEQSGPKAELNDEERRVYLFVTEHLLKITNYLLPGLSRSAAQLKYCISSEKVSQTENDFISGKIVHATFKDEIQKLDAIIDDAYKFFKTDTTKSFNGAPGPEAAALEALIDNMKTLVLLASNEYLPVKLSPKK